MREKDEKLFSSQELEEDCDKMKKERQLETFLKCKTTGKVTYAGAGWAIWHPCVDCS